MKRKIMKVSESTYVVSIPLKWVRASRIEKGQEVELEQQGKNILIRLETAPARQEKHYSGEIGDNTLAGDRLIVSLYRQGYSQMDVSYTNPKFVKRLPAILSENTLGLAILSQNESKARIIGLYNDANADLGGMLKRMMFMIIDLAKDIEEGINGCKYQELSDMPAREEHVNQFMNYCIRVLNSGGQAELSRPYAIYDLARKLESLSDSYRDLAVNHSEKRLPADRQLLANLAKANLLLAGIYDAQYSFSLAKIEKILAEADSLIGDINAAMKARRNVNVVLDYVQLHQIADKLKQLCSPITELNL
jgi:phosphate uptake regulator